MRRGLRVLVPAVMISATLMLSGCKSAEEKAEDYYQSGLTLLAAGDEERALVEFRNVFQYNGFHKDARKTYADLVLKRGEVAEAYSQYLRLIEQYPDMVEVRQILAEIALTNGDWVEVERHGKAAMELAPASPASRAIGAALDYRKGVLDNDAAGKASAVVKAQAVLAELPDNKVARRIVIDSLANGASPQDAMPEIDKALTLEPASLELNMMKFRLLVQQDDVAGTGEQLKKMFTLFPENQEVRSALVSWYLVRRDIDGAEAFLRQLAGDATGAPDGHLAVIQLLQAARGPEAAAKELDSLIAANAGQPNSDLYRALRATMDFEAGKQTEAIAAFEDVLKAAPASDQTRRIKAMLARALSATGNKVGARGRVEEILAEDPTQIEALKLRAAWLIEEDKPGAAIVDLRAALSQDARDPTILTLMATAHERDGSPELAGERLAMAVEVSGRSVEDSLRYVNFLQRTGGPTAVIETVLTDALQVTPNSIPLLQTLAQRHLAASDWGRVTDIITQLRQIGSKEAAGAADELQTGLLLGQNKTDESITYLQDLIDKGDTNTSAIAMVLQTQVRSGKIPEARAYLDQRLATAPQDAGLRMLSASLYTLTNEDAAAEKIYRALITEDAKAEAAIRALYALLQKNNRAEDAAAVLKAGLEALPASGALRWMQAGDLERSGDIEGAIAVYDTLYAEDTSSLVIANNLASLIATHHDDPASLERAFAIARRLHGTQVPAFQDTYGWIEYRRGNLEEALKDLEPAAAGLPDDALTQYHLGMTYAGLGQADKAKATLTRALDLAKDSPLPQFKTARDTLDALNSGAVAPPKPAATTPTTSP